MNKPESLVDLVLTHQFPYYKNCDFHWSDTRYNNNGLFRWDQYYNHLCNLEQILYLCWKTNLISLYTFRSNRLKVNHHRIKFVNRLYRIGILDYRFYRLLKMREGCNGLSLYEYRDCFTQINPFSVHPKSKSNKRITSIELKLSCNLNANININN